MDSFSFCRSDSFGLLGHNSLPSFAANHSFDCHDAHPFANDASRFSSQWPSTSEHDFSRTSRHDNIADAYQSTAGFSPRFTGGFEEHSCLPFHRAESTTSSACREPDQNDTENIEAHPCFSLSGQDKTHHSETHQFNFALSTPPAITISAAVIQVAKRSSGVGPPGANGVAHRHPYTLNMGMLMAVGHALSGSNKGARIDLKKFLQFLPSWCRGGEYDPLQIGAVDQQSGQSKGVSMRNSLNIHFHNSAAYSGLRMSATVIANGTVKVMSNAAVKGFHNAVFSLVLKALNDAQTSAAKKGHVVFIGRTCRGKLAFSTMRIDSDLDQLVSVEDLVCFIQQQKASGSMPWLIRAEVGAKSYGARIEVGGQDAPVTIRVCGTGKVQALNPEGSNKKASNNFKLSTLKSLASQFMDFACEHRHEFALSCDAKITRRMKVAQKAHAAKAAKVGLHQLSSPEMPCDQLCVSMPSASLQPALCA